MPTVIEPIRRPSLVSEVVTLLREVIETRGLEPGDRLPTEAELVRSLEVSRPVLREAVSQLESLGLVRVRRGIGMFVGDRDSLAGSVKLIRTALAVTPRNLAQLAELHGALARHVARRAAELATEADVTELQRLWDASARPSVPHEEAAGMEPAFHSKLLAITGNDLMLNVMSVLQQFMAGALPQTTLRPRDRGETRRVDRAVLDAVRRGDPDAAEAAMRVHTGATGARLESAPSPRSGPASRSTRAPGAARPPTNRSR